MEYLPSGLHVDLGTGAGIPGIILRFAVKPTSSIRKKRKTIDKTEKDNFIGKEALKNSNKKCRTWGLRVEKGTAMKGKNLKINGKIVGEITSSTWSPYQVCGVGIVRMQNNKMGPGTVVDVNCTNGKIQKGELCELPMYDPNGDIVRGKNKEIPNKPNPWSGIKK